MIKTYYAEKEGLDPKDIAVVSIMPCTAKKFEAQREEPGGVRPQQPSSVRNWENVAAERASALYKSDADSFLRKSHKNPVIKELYANYLGEPGGEKAHHLLHTHYVKR